ncbi:MAG: DNA polymerase III subunit beta [Verrucomicrobia bacterium]|nr:DNA polymerase III subunit beta [Verrucomicrobiota bacterium]
MNPLSQEKIDAIAAVCRRYGVSRLESFGSACTDDFDPNRSDLDFLVEFPPGSDLGPWLARFLELKEALTQLLGRPVDIVMGSALRNPWFRREAAKTRRVVYDASQMPQMAS